MSTMAVFGHVLNLAEIVFLLEELRRIYLHPNLTYFRALYVFSILGTSRGKQGHCLCVDIHCGEHCPTHIVKVECQDRSDLLGRIHSSGRSSRNAVSTMHVCREGPTIGPATRNRYSISRGWIAIDHLKVVRSQFQSHKWIPEVGWYRCSVHSRERDCQIQFLVFWIA